jgi:hypothetical protein|tara:strand:+ start:2346 stop:2585 length:240 start_codon:yes stop_codon:yes gene_type:complete
MENNKIKELTFDGKVYLIEDLTPRIIDSLSVLFNAQQEANKKASELSIFQAAQSAITENIRSFIKEDKIKSQPKIEKAQ